MKLLLEIHSGSYGNHAASRTLVGKAFRAGFYWPTAITDVEDLVRRCEGCQFFAKQIHVPAQELQTIPASWPFACWGLDMIGPFKPTPGGFWYVYVAIDKFSKWIEYKPLISATTKKAVELFEDIIHDLVYQTALSPISELHLLDITSGTSAKTVASPSNMFLLPIQEPTVKSNGRTV